MGKIERIDFNGERIYLKKDWTGWRVVEPIIDPETKKFSWKNFLSKKGFLTLGYLLFLFLVLWLAFREQISNYYEVLKNPCSYCLDCQNYARGLIGNLSENDSFNIPNLRI